MNIFFKFSGDSAPLKLFDCLAANIELAKDIGRLKPRELSTPAMACGPGSVETSDPLVKRYKIACRGLKLRCCLLHPELLAASTLVRGESVSMFSLF
jgi:hypothetical protein